MMNLKRLFLLFSTLAGILPVFAQNGGRDTVLKNSVIEIVQSYKPQVRQAPKPVWVPQLPPPDTMHPVFNYVVPQQSLYYSYHSDALRPLALGKDTVPTPLPNYLKAGIGNLYTLYIDAGIGNLSTPDYDVFLHIHHLSQSGNIRFQQTALTGIESEGMYHKDNNEWHARLLAERDQYFYYGYNHTIYDYTKSDSLRQTYTTVRAVADYKRKEIGDSKLDYHPSINASLFNARFNAYETNFGFTAPFTYDVDTAIQAQLNLSGNITNFKTDSPSSANNLIQLAAGINYNKEPINGRGYLGFAVGHKGKFSVLPDISATYPIGNIGLLLRGGWLSSIRQNTYEQIATENPYVTNQYATKQLRSDELYVDLSGNFTSLNFSAKASWLNLKSLPTYLDTIGDRKQFNVLYDTVSAISLQLGARYIFANIYSISLKGDFYEFYQGTEQHPWQIPDTRVTGYFSVKPIPDLSLNAYLSVLGGMHAIDANNKVISMKTITDIGINGEYKLNLRLYLFLQGSNLLNSNYQRWMGYSSYGLNIYAGVRMKF